MRTGVRLILCSLLLLLAGCTAKTMKRMMEKITPPEDDALAREFVAALLREDYEFMLARVDSGAFEGAPLTVLQQLYEYIDHDVPKMVELVGCNVVSSGTRRQSSLTYQLEFPHSWYTFTLAIVTDAGTRKAIGFHLKQLPASLAEINRFTLKGRKPIHYIVLLNAVGVPLLILYSLVRCIRTRMKKKWLWIPFILIGIGAVQLNWTTGQIGLQALSFHIPGAALVRWGPCAPWILTISFPLGAILFLRKRRRFKVAVAPGIAAAPSANEAPPVSSNRDCATTCPDVDQQGGDAETSGSRGK